MKFYVSNPVFSKRPIEYRSVTYYRLISKGYKYELETDTWTKTDVKERKRVINPLTNREINVGDNPFMVAIRTGYILYDEDNNKLVLVPKLKELIEKEERHYIDPFCCEDSDDSDFEYDCDEFDYDEDGYGLICCP